MTKADVSMGTVPVTQTPIKDLYLAKEAPKGANLEVRDSGAGSPMTDAEMKASLYSNGVIQPLIYKVVDGKRYTIAGNRRLRFMREILVDAPDSVLPTQDVANFPGDWREIAMATNISLPPHLVERYEVIVQVAKDQKLPEKEVCARFGMSEMQWRRVMALAKMAPIVRQAWKEAKIDARTAQAFTLEPDAKEQEKIFNTLSKQGSFNGYQVRNRIVPATQQQLGTLIEFLGVEAVKKAKLLKQEDLFGSDHIVSDVKGLKRMVSDRLRAIGMSLIETGWSWAVTVDELEGMEFQYGDVTPDEKKAKPTTVEKARLDEIAELRKDGQTEIDDALIEEEEQLRQTIECRGYSDAQKARAGCILKVGHNGKLTIVYGKVKPADKPKTSAAERRAAAPATPAKKPNKPGDVTLTNGLAISLSQQLEKAISQALPTAPYVAVAAIIAGFASSGHVVNVDIGKRDASPSKNLADRQFVQIFESALKASDKKQVEMLADIASHALDIEVSGANASLPIESAAFQALVAALPKDIVNRAIDANFDIEAYFAAVDLRTCVEAVRCAMGDEHAAKVAKMKKGIAAAFAASHLKKAGYLPPAMRTKHYSGPTEQVKAKAKRAPAKKAAKKTAKKKR